MQHVVEIDPQGRLRFVYSDELAGLLQIGAACVERVSYVTYLGTNTGSHGQPGWYINLSSVNGPRSVGPFSTYGDAVAAEIKWLRDHDTPSIELVNERSIW